MDHLQAAGDAADRWATHYSLLAASLNLLIKNDRSAIDYWEPCVHRMVGVCRVNLGVAEPETASLDIDVARFSIRILEQAIQAAEAKAEARQSPTPQPAEASTDYDADVAAGRGEC